MPIACPRHGLVDVTADAPCPVCGVPAYDLHDRGARDVVRKNRAFALKTRIMACGVVCFVVAGAAAHLWSPLHLRVFGLDLVTLLVAGSAASFLSRRLAVTVEPDVRLRGLDRVLAARRL
jgi:hypothetical protein